MADVPQGQALLDGIERLRRELDAVILAHYYQDSEIQDLADFVGDSLQLSQQAAKTGRELVKWPGFCIVHEQFTERQLQKLKVRHPEAKLIAHPECEASVLAIADFVGSTRGLLEYVKTSPAKSFIVATEVGILHLMSKARPDAELIPAPPSSGCNCSICPYMRLNSLEKLYLCMRDRTPEVTLPEG